MEHSKNHSDSDDRDKDVDGLPNVSNPMFSAIEFRSELDEYYDLTTATQIEIQDVATTSPPRPDQLDMLIIAPVSSQNHENLSQQWSQNETMHLGIQDKLLPCLQDLMEFPFSSNWGHQSIESNEMIHFDGSEFDVPSVLELEDAGGIAAFSAQEEEVGLALGGTLEILGTPSYNNYHISYNDEQDQLLFPNHSREQEVSWARGDGFGIKTPNPNSSQDADSDVDSESHSEFEYAGNVAVKGQLDLLQVEEKLGSCFIRNKQKRTARFLKGWTSLQAKTKLINARTGATSNLEAIMDTERFTMPKQKCRNDSTIRSSDTVADTSDGNESDNDHRYAAVILTQKVSSQSVSDHQYNFRASKASDADLADEVSSPSSKPVFLKLRYIRERQLVSFLNSIFVKIDNLKAMTGATILLTVAYEDHVFDDSNHKEAESLLRNKRRDRFGVSAIPTFIASNDSSVKNSNAPYAVVVDKDPVEEDDCPGVHIRFVIKEKKKDSKNKKGPTSIPKTSKKPKISKSRPSSSAVSTDSETRKRYLPPLHPIRRSVDNIEIPDHWYGRMDSVEMDADEIDDSASELTTLSGPPSESASMITIPDLPIVNFRSTSISSRDTNTGWSATSTSHIFTNSTREVGTSTEPVCLMCSSNYPPSTSSAIRPPENFWIRCYDPFCQQMVHPSCIGFRITSSKCLKMLPPYYCNDHRSD